MKKSVLNKFLTLAVVSLGTAFNAFASSDNYVGNGAEGKLFAVFEPKLVNISAADATWLPSSVMENFKTNIRLYTGMDYVEMANTAEIIEIQKKSNGIAFSEDSALAVGELLSAQYGILSQITKTGSTYQLSCSITDLTSGVASTTTVNNISKSNDLYGSALNKALLQILDQKNILNVQLTSMAKYSLRTGVTDLSADQQLMFASQEAKSYEENLKRLSEELRRYNTSEARTNETLRSQKAKLEAEQELLKQKQQIAQKKVIQLQLQAQKEEEERKAAMQRSDEANRRLRELSSAADNEAAKIREQQYASMSVEERIILIETKKKAFIDIRKTVEAAERAEKEAALKEYELKKKGENDILKYVNMGLSESEAKTRVEASNMELKAKYLLDAEVNAKAITSSTEKKLNELLREINKDKSNLGNVEHSSSLVESGLFSIRNYDPNARKWIADISIYLGSYPFITDQIDLSYEEVTGVKAPADLARASDAQLMEYTNNFQIYNSMFRMGTPVLYAEVDYKVEPMEDKYPSCYTITALQYRIINSTTGKTLKVIKPSAPPAGLEYNPINEIRSDEQIKTDAKNTAVANAKREEKTAFDAIYNPKAGAGGRTSLGVSLSGGINPAVENAGLVSGGVQLYGILSVTPHFWADVCGIITTAESGVFLDLGYSTRLKMFGRWPCIYVGLGAGINGDEITSSSSSSKDSNDASSLALRGLVGFDIPVTKSLSIELQLEAGKIVDTYTQVSVGVQLVSPSLVLF